MINNIRTKPAAVANKIGDIGQAVPLKANYFKLKKFPNWKIFQYRVDMKPEVDYTKVSRLSPVHMGTGVYRIILHGILCKGEGIKVLWKGGGGKNKSTKIFFLLLRKKKQKCVGGEKI